MSISNSFVQNDLSNLFGSDFYISDALKRTIDCANVLKIIQGRSIAPSALAGLKPDELCRSLHEIDEIYEDAILGYQKSLKDADNKDTMTLVAIAQNWVASVEAEQAKKRNVFEFFVEVFKDIGASFAAIPELLGRKNRSESQLMDYTNSHKVKELLVIDAKEKDRIETMRKIIHNRATILITEMKKLESSNQICNRRINELTQLVKVFKAHFPQQSLQISNGTNVENLDKLLK